MWFGWKLLQRSDSTLTHEVIKLTEENIWGGGIVFAAPSPSSYYPQTPAAPNSPSVTDLSAVPVRNTSSDVTDYITFPDRRRDVSLKLRGKDGLYAPSPRQPVDYFTSEGKTLTSF